MEKRRNGWWEWTKALVIAVAVAALIRYFLFTPIVVDGLSMMPTLHNGDRMIVNKVDYRVSAPERFDVIVFHAPEHKDYIKRVIGLPGDTIEFSNDQLYVNGEPVDEPYLANYKNQLSENRILTGDFSLADIGLTEVPEGQLFVMGDNRLFSKDSRHIGTIPIEQVVGTTSAVFWPLAEIRSIEADENN